MNYWRMSFRIGSQGTEMWEECRKQGIAAIGAYDKNGDPVVRDCSRLTEEALTQAFRKKKPRNSARLFSFKNLVYRMQVGDIIYAKQGPYIVGRGVIKSGYQYDPNILKGSKARWEHFVRVDWEENFESVPILLGAERITILPLSKERVRLLENAIGTPLSKPPRTALAPTTGESSTIHPIPAPPAISQHRGDTGREEKRKQLKEIYQAFQQQAPPDWKRFPGLEGPALVWMSDEYLQASPKIAIIGQQVREWYSYHSFVSQMSIDDAIAVTRNSEERHKRHLPFRRFFHQISEKAFPEEPEAWRKLLRTNLIKFVCSGREPSILKKLFAEELLNWQKDVLREELRIAEPEICIFVTGPDYDQVLELCFPGVRREQLDLPEQRFARLVHEDLPVKSYRTYNPRYLLASGLWAPVFQCLDHELGWGS